MWNSKDGKQKFEKPFKRFVFLHLHFTAVTGCSYNPDQFTTTWTTTGWFWPWKEWMKPAGVYPILRLWRVSVMSVDCIAGLCADASPRVWWELSWCCNRTSHVSVTGKEFSYRKSRHVCHLGLGFPLSGNVAKYGICKIFLRQYVL